jgi:hypothetical protein
MLDFPQLYWDFCSPPAVKPTQAPIQYVGDLKLFRRPGSWNCPLTSKEWGQEYMEICSTLSYMALWHGEQTWWLSVTYTAHSTDGEHFYGCVSKKLHLSELVSRCH